jgi:copper transport protein
VVSRRLLIAAAALAALLVAPAAAGAHAMLQASTPDRGVTVARAPAQVVFHFDEPVEGNFGAVRVFDAQGDRVDDGKAFHPGGNGPQLAVRLEDDLPDGTYTATYRVVSADGHVVSGGIVFSIGHPGAAGQTVEELLGSSGAGTVTGVAFAVARAVQYAAIAVAGGVLAFLLAVWIAALAATAGAGARWQSASAAFLARVRLLVAGAALAGTLSALAAVALETAEGAGVSFWSALHPSLLSETLGTRFGTVWTIGAGCWVLLGAGAALALSPGRRAAPALRKATVGATGLALPATAWAPLALAAVPIAFLVALPALSGHGATQDPVAVLLPANVLHVAAMAVWVGGVTALLLAVPAATRALEPTERTQLLAATLVRFSTLALGAVVVLLLSGLVQSLVEVRHLDLVLSTAFGRAVVIKLVLVLALIGLGAVNRRRTIPRLQAAARERRTPGTDGVLLRRTLRAELLLMAAALGVTGALAGYAPSIAKDTGPYTTTTRIGPQELQLTLDPAKVGANQIHLYLTDPRTGAQLDTAKEVTVAAALPAKGIGKIDGDARKAGPGHYVVTALTVAPAGTWQVTVTVRVSDFDEYIKKLEVPIR